MAISVGFPPSNMVGPGIWFNEQDLTYQTATPSFHRTGLVGFASKGPINTPTLITSVKQLNTTFGFPHPDQSDPYLIYAAQLYLAQGNQLYVVRVANTDPVSDEAAATASVSVPAVGDLVTAVAANVEPYVLSNAVPYYYFSWSLNGVEASKQLAVPAGTYTALQLAEELNSQLNIDVDGITFITIPSSSGNLLAVQATWAYGVNSSIELISVQDAIYGANSVVALGSEMTQAEVQGTSVQYPVDSYHTAGQWDWSAIGSDTGTLNIVVDGTDNVNIDTVVQTITLSQAALTDFVTGETGLYPTTKDIVTFINDQVENAAVPGGFYAVGGGATTGPDGLDLSTDPDFSNYNITLRTLASGVGSRILVKSSGTLASIFGFPNTMASGTTPTGYTGDLSASTGGKVYGAANTTSQQTFTITADSAGIEGNQTVVQITNLTSSPGFQMAVYNNGSLVENWGPLTKDQNSSYYVSTFLQLSSQYIQVVDDTTVAYPPAGGTYVLVGGSDGLPSDPIAQDALLVGTSTSMTGMFALSDPEQINIDLVACPGHSSSTVVLALIALCEQYRMDCMAIIDPPFGLTPTEIVQWQQGSHPLNRDQLNSDCAALYWPWVQISDSFNGINVWVPPSGAVLATYAYSDSIGNPWSAPAGMTRGIVSGITGVFAQPTAAERNLMYQMTNAINPIVTFSDVANYLIWGDKTLQQTPTLLDRVPVRRLLFFIEKSIRAACRKLLFEPHTQAFHDAFTTIASTILNQVMVGGGIYNFIIDDDWSLNTPTVVAQNEFRANIGIQPIPTVEFIFVTFSLHNQGTWDTSNT